MVEAVDRNTLELYLAQTEHHIDGAQRLVEQQARIRMKAEGRPTELAEEILTHFKASLAHRRPRPDLPCLAIPRRALTL
jgi:hypothetical protein